MRTLVIGAGNLLLGDEGLGVHAARALLAAPFSPGCDVVEAGTSLFEALAGAQSYDRVVLIDAIAAGGAPGTVYRMEIADIDSDLERAPAPLSLHEWSIADSLHAARLAGVLPRCIFIIGAEPAVIEPGMTLSPPASAALGKILGLLARDLGAFPPSLPGDTLPTS